MLTFLLLVYHGADDARDGGLESGIIIQDVIWRARRRVSSR